MSKEGVFFLGIILGSALALVWLFIIPALTGIPWS